MIRFAALVLALATTTARAEPRDLELDHPGVATIVAKTVETGGRTLISTFTYDAHGRLATSDVRLADNSAVLTTTNTRDAAGRITRSTYKDKQQTIVREIAYTVDKSGRVTERIERDPAANPKEYRRYEYIWDASGGHSEQAYRHYAKEGPYRSDSKMFDAAGRLTRDCYEHGGCAMIELDAHGEIDRIRQQTKDEHHYLVYENTYDKAGRLATQKIGNRTSRYTWGPKDLASVVDSDDTRTVATTTYTITYR